MTRSTMRSTAAGSAAASPAPRPSARRASAIALCAQRAALPCVPRACTRPARTCARNSAGVAAKGVSENVRPMSMPAWSSVPPMPVPPCVSM